MKKFDVAVIGLGALGSAALYQLSKMKQNIVGIDMYEPPHSLGSSFGESRVTRQAIGEGASYVPIVLRANEIWAELEKLSGQELYSHCGMLIAGYTEQQFVKNTLQAAQDYSINYQLLTSDEVKQLFPAIAARQTNQLFYYEPMSGYLRPEKCIAVQLQAAKDNGAEVLLNTTVESLDETPYDVQIKLTDGSIIEAAKLIVAAGPWIKDMLVDVLGPLLKTQLQTQYWFAIDPAYYDQLLPGKMPVFLCGDERTETTRSFYGFPAINGKTGGIKFAVHESDVEVEPAAKDAATPVTSAEEVYGFVSRHVKHIKPEVLRSANCLYTTTPDEDFILDFLPDSERIIIGSACSGHGFKHSSASGEILAQLATGQHISYDISKFSIDRFRH